MAAAGHYDLVVAGAGAAGMTAAAVAASQGMRVLLVEKTALVGGTTAWSGGMVWVPANRQMLAAGMADSLDAARRYLAATVASESGAAMREAFLTHAGEAIDYLAAHTPVRLRPVTVYPDYYPDRPGATLGGRVLEPCPFDARALGSRFALLRPPLPEFTLFGGMMVSRPDITHFRRVFRSAHATWRVASLLARHARERLTAPRGTSLYLGNALAGRLLLAVTELGVELRLGTRIAALRRDGRRVSGLVLRNGSDDEAELTCRAVVLATGGFSHDAGLRARMLSPAAGPLSAAAPGNAGDGIRLGLDVGGELGTANASGAFWVPASRSRRADGSECVFPHTVTDRAKPGLIAVDDAGQRFVNEAVSYHEFVLAMLRHGLGATRPAYLVCDRRFLWTYGLGRVRPFSLRLREHLASHYLHAAPSLGALALTLGIDAAGLTATVAAHNADARAGVDRRFGRGSDAYQRHLGDADHRPNPCLAPLETPPFYAVAVYPADLGTATGLLTDARARVLAADGTPVPGLYACGNDMNSVMNGAYPGPGITLGPALTFGYLAARDAAQNAALGPG